MRTPRRPYNQYCAAARALEIVGERWTLLVVRELLTGPKRYTDLVAALPGVGTNLLAERLKELERFDVVHRHKLPPPAASSVYALTELGEGLRDVVRAMERWGSQLLGSPREGETVRPIWSVLAMECTFRPEEARGLRESYEFRIDNDVFHLRVAENGCKTIQGHASEPDLVVECDQATYFELAERRLDHETAVANGALRFIRGDLELMLRVLNLFGSTHPSAGAPQVAAPASADAQSSTR